MSVTRGENYVTEMFLIDFYNSSQKFREFIAHTFCETLTLDKKLVCTCDRRENPPKFGNPDACTKDKKLYIEVKTRKYTPLTDLESDEGADYIKNHGKWTNLSKVPSNKKEGDPDKETCGYKRFIEESKEHRLLYIVPKGYQYLDKAVYGGNVKKKKHGNQVRTIYWEDITSFIKEMDAYSPRLKVIKKIVDHEERVEHDSGDYFAKLLKVIMNLTANHNDVSIDTSDYYLDDYSADENEGFLNYVKIKGAQELYLGFDEEDVHLSLERKFEKSDIPKKLRVMGYEKDTDRYIKRIVDMTDFWGKEALDIAEDINKEFESLEKGGVRLEDL